MEGDAGLQEQVQKDAQFNLSFKHAGKLYSLQLHATDMVLDLKSAIFSLTNVPPERQKIIGITRTLPNDEICLSELHLENLKKPFTLIGTADGEEVKRMKEAGDTVDADADIAADEQTVTQSQAIRNERKIQEAVDRLKDLEFMNLPRTGKKLICFDLDYTLLDCTGWLTSEVDLSGLARPFLNDCLTRLSPYYDFVIWSQTSWRFLEAKLVELGMINDRYNISCVLDKTSMFEVVSKRNGASTKHHVKPLEILWRKFPDYFSPANTCHVDDLQRNFVLNPENGIKIRAFKDARSHQNDRELALLTAFLLSVKDEPDLRACDLKDWRKQAKLLAGEID